jgi:hypothetical protein
LAKDNLAFGNLCDYAVNAVAMLTSQRLCPLEFAKNINNQPDISIFDSSVFYEAVCPSKYRIVNDRPLFHALVGDSLINVKSMVWLLIRHL